MKLRRTVNIKKSTEYWDLHKDLPGITLIVTKEGSKIKDIILTGKGPHGTSPMLVPLEFLDYLKTRNPWGEGWGWAKAEFDLKEVLSGEIEIVPEQLIFPYSAGNVLFDHKGKVMEQIEIYDYIGTPFTNKACHLKKMLEHLKKSPYVIHEVDDELIIEDVPYYNNESGREKHIRGKVSGVIRIRMPLKIREEIYQRAIERRAEFFSIEMKELTVSGPVYGWTTTHKDEKDYLGIRQFLKEKPVLY